MNHKTLWLAGDYFEQTKDRHSKPEDNRSGRANNPRCTAQHAQNTIPSRQGTDLPRHIQVTSLEHFLRREPPVPIS